MFTWVGQPMPPCCGAVCGGQIREGTMLLAQLSASFQSLPLLPTIKLSPSGADSQVSGFVYILGPCGSPQHTLLWGWEFLPPSQPSQVFIARAFEVLFPCTGALGCVVCLAPQLFLPVYLHTNVGSPGPAATALPWVLSIPAAHLHPLLLVWINVSSLPLGCQTSIQFDFLAVLVNFCF